MQGLWGKGLKCFVNDFDCLRGEEHIEVVHETTVALADVLHLDVEVEDTGEFVDYAEGALAEKIS